VQAEANHYPNEVHPLIIARLAGEPFVVAYFGGK